MKIKTGIPWIQDEVDPQARSWEDFYRNRWQQWTGLVTVA